METRAASRLPAATQPHSTRQAATASHCELALENLRTLEQPDERTHCAHGVAYTRTTSTQNADANRVTEESRRLRTVPIAKCHRAFTCHGARLPASHPSSLLVGQREGGQSAVAMTGTIRAACQCTSVYWPPHSARWRSPTRGVVVPIECAGRAVEEKKEGLETVLKHTKHTTVIYRLPDQRTRLAPGLKV